MVLYCAPPYVLGFLMLLAFDPFFGVLPLSFLIDPSRFGKPFPDLPHFLRGDDPALAGLRGPDRGRVACASLSP